jgi:hypothetical protein
LIKHNTHSVPKLKQNNIMNRNRQLNTMFHSLNFEVIIILEKHLNNKNDNYKYKESYEDLASLKQIHLVYGTDLKRQRQRIFE